MYVATYIYGGERGILKSEYVYSQKRLTPNQLNQLSHMTQHILGNIHDNIYNVISYLGSSI